MRIASWRKSTRDVLGASDPVANELNVIAIDPDESHVGATDTDELADATLSLSDFVLSRLKPSVLAYASAVLDCELAQATWQVRIAEFRQGVDALRAGVILGKELGRLERASTQARADSARGLARVEASFEAFGRTWQASYLRFGAAPEQQLDSARSACVLQYETGSYALILKSVGDAKLVTAALLTTMTGAPPVETTETVTRVQHVGPVEVLDGVALDSAVVAKQLLEALGCTVDIREKQARTEGLHREPIPERVRNEVWRRDGGECVDCASRERLEYDHIIAVANGGSNTARNIELRCETCNRKKGAKI